MASEGAQGKWGGSAPRRVQRRGHNGIGDHARGGRYCRASSVPRLPRVEGAVVLRIVLWQR